MKSIKRYATEAAYNADVQSNNIVANQVSKTMDTGEVHYIINDYTYTLTFDSQNTTPCYLHDTTILMFTEAQLGMLTELQFNILKNGGREFYLQDTQDSTTYHIQEVTYSISAPQRFGWETEEELEEMRGIIAQCFEDSVTSPQDCFLFMRDVIELNVENKGKMFILRTYGNETTDSELLLVEMGIDEFVEEIEYLYSNPPAIDA